MDINRSPLMMTKMWFCFTCSLLRVTVLGENLINGQKTRSHLWLVDLAGSERLDILLASISGQNLIFAKQDT